VILHFCAVLEGWLHLLQILALSLADRTYAWSIRINTPRLRASTAPFLIQYLAVLGKSPTTLAEFARFDAQSSTG